jgi:hypothetical protein
VTYTVKISAANAAKIRPLCDATRYHPARLVNLLVDYALQHVRLTPTADAVYDIRLWSGSTAPSTHNTMQLLPQLADIHSGLRGK